jgi:uncharacterized protein YjdB
VEDSSVSVSGVSLSPAALTLGVGQEQTLTAAVEPENAANKALTWASDKPDIAEVDENGKVTGIAVGTAAITVTTVDGGKTAVCAVTVQKDAVAIAVSGVSLDRETFTLGVNQELTLTAAVEPENAANKAVTWTSSDTSVATVGADGKVTGVAVGTATVTVTTADGSHKDTCVVTVQTEAVTIAVTGVSLSPKSLTLGVGQEQTLTAAVTPPEAANKAVIWASDKPDIAAVDGNGKVTGAAPGTATVTVTTADGGKTDTCAVTVQQEAAAIPVTGVSLSPKTLFLAAGTTGVLTAAVAPSQAANKAVTWTSSNTSVAAVDNNGTVSALAEGEAVITVTTGDGNKTDTCAIAVKRFTITNTGEWNSAIEAVIKGGDNQSYTLVINGEVRVPGTSAGSGGTFTMNGGTVSGNESSQGNGGGVYVTAASTFTKSGGGSIRNNDCESGSGKQVYYNGTPPKYRNDPLEESDNISTDDLETNWEN